MKIVYNWLKEYVDSKATAAELRARLSLTGTPVDAIEETAATIMKLLARRHGMPE